MKVIAGSYDKVEGPVKHIPVDPLYLDVTLPPNAKFHLPVKKGYTVFAQAIEGAGCFDPMGAPAVGEETQPLYSSPFSPSDESVSRPGHTVLYGDGGMYAFMRRKEDCASFWYRGNHFTSRSRGTALSS